jgi:hypothetical protein
MIYMTTEMIRSQRSSNGGWSRRQLDAIGVEWPPKKGWLDAAAGPVTEGQWDAFQRCAEDDAPKRPNTISTYNPGPAFTEEQMKDFYRQVTSK